MAIYDITYQCGHQMQVNMAGGYADRQAQIYKMQKEMCPACKAAEQERFKAKNECRKNLIESKRVSMLNKNGTISQPAHHCAAPGEIVDREKREKAISIRLSENELHMLKRVCQIRHISQSQLIVSMIVDAYYRLPKMAQYGKEKQ